MTMASKRCSECGWLNGAHAPHCETQVDGDISSYRLLAPFNVANIARLEGLAPGDILNVDDVDYVVDDDGVYVLRARFPVEALPVVIDIRAATRELWRGREHEANASGTLIDALTLEQRAEMEASQRRCCSATFFASEAEQLDVRDARLNGFRVRPAILGR